MRGEGKTRRTVVTGMGIVSPLGCGIESFWRALREGRSGIGPITRFDAAGYAYTRGGQIAGFEEAERARFGIAPPACDLGTRFVLAAADEALRAAGLEDAGRIGRRVAVVLATNFGGVLSGEAVFEEPAAGRRFAPDAFAEYGFQRAADHVAARWGLEGPRLVLSLSCASGAAAIAVGCDLIRAGRADVALTAGYDTLSRFAWAGLSALRTMTADAVRPFDRRRSGTVFSEGAGVLVIEALEHALARGAAPLAEVAGCAMNNNAFHMTAPAREGAGTAAVMREALADAGLPPEAIEHVNAHGTGTVPNDTTEAQAIWRVFGGRTPAIPVTSIKSMTGHMMGAAGSAEAVASILSMRDGVIPPTTNYAEQDPACNLDVVANQPRERRLACVLSNSAGIGGCNAAAVFRKAE